jgi:hypothetical protein
MKSESVGLEHENNSTLALSVLSLIELDRKNS